MKLKNDEAFLNCARNDRLLVNGDDVQTAWRYILKSVKTDHITNTGEGMLKVSYYIKK